MSAMHFPPERFLNTIKRILGKERRPFHPPASFCVRHCGGFVEIWFPSGGCHWDLKGYCSMCNFGLPYRVSPARMIEAVRLALDELSQDVPETIWVSSFNMLDEREVPDDVRRQILRAIGEMPVKRVIIETHVDSIREDVVRECTALLPDRLFGVELGIESTNDFVRRCCINKDIPRTRITEVINQCHSAGASVLGNILVGAPFLTRAEAVEDACQSIIVADEMGVDEFVVFPVHVKPHTIVHWLFQHELYRPPTIWDLVDLLSMLNKSHRKRTTCAWITPKEHPGAPVGVAPYVGHDDADEILAKLSAFSYTDDEDALEWLFQYPRMHKSAGNNGEAHSEPLIQRVQQGYERLGIHFFGDSWWERNRRPIVAWLQAQWEQAS